MPSDFETAVRVVLRHEGGLANHAADPGGITKYGISLRWFKSILADANEDDITNMTHAQAKALYRRYWWNEYGFERFSDQDTATKVFDMAVNMGAHQAVRLLQRALCNCGHQVDVDGILGPKTIEAANSVQRLQLLSKLVGEQSDFYRALAQRKPEMQCFLAGWLARAVWPLGRLGQEA